jgi:hypothetical protein
MSDLREMAENAALHNIVAELVRREHEPAPDKPSERVENVATALLVALPIAVLILGPPLS